MSPSRCQVCQLPDPIRKEVDRRLTSGSADGSGGKVSAWLAAEHKLEVKRTVLNEHRRAHLGVRPGVAGGKKKREEAPPPPPPAPVATPAVMVRPEVVQLDTVLGKLVSVATRLADHFDARLKVAETLSEVGLGESADAPPDGAPAAPKKRPSLVTDAEASLMTGLGASIEKLAKTRYLIAEGKLGRGEKEAAAKGGLKGVLLDAQGQPKAPEMPAPLEGDLPDVGDDEMPGYEPADATPAPTAADGAPVTEHAVPEAPPPAPPPPPSGSGVRPDAAEAPPPPQLGMAVGAGVALPWSIR